MAAWQQLSLSWMLARSSLLKYLTQKPQVSIVQTYVYLVVNMSQSKYIPTRYQVYEYIIPGTWYLLMCTYVQVETAVVLITDNKSESSLRDARIHIRVRSSSHTWYNTSYNGTR